MITVALEDFQRFMSRDNPDMAIALDYIAICLNPDSPTHLINRVRLSSCVMKVWKSVPNEQKDEYGALCERLDKAFEELGYRDNGMLTYQEHLILPNTVSDYSATPYTPLGIIFGQMTIAEALKARQLAQVNSAQGQWFCMQKSERAYFALEPLDEKGSTIRDPRMVDDNLHVIATQYSPNFPFRRPDIS